MVDFCADLAEFAGASDLLKPRQGVTSLEQLVRDTKKKEKEREAHARARAARESLETQRGDGEPELLAVPPPALVPAEADQPEPPASQQCLFPDLAEEAADVALEASDLRGACPLPEALEGDEAAASATRVAQQDAIRQLLVGGLLPDYCRVSGGCPTGIAQELFRLMARSPDLTVANAAFDAFVSVLGLRLSCDPLAQPLLVVTSAAEQFDGPQRSSSSTPAWLPGDEALLSALHSCGYRSPGATGGAKPLKSSPAKGGGGGSRAAGSKRSAPITPGAQPDSGGGEAGPLLARLRLLLRFIPVLCKHDEVHDGAKRRGGLRPAGLQRLVAALLRLRLDATAAALATELQAALAALLRAFPSDKEWGAALPGLASDLASLGPSHRAHLAAVTAIPSDSERGAQLQAAAATLLLTRLVPPLKGAAATAPVPSLLDIGPWAVVQGLWWQAHAAETRRAAQASFRGTAKFDVWELDTAVRAADLLLWPPTLALARRVAAEEQQAGDAERAKYIKGAGWHTTLRCLHNELRNVVGGWQMPAIRLAGYVDCVDQRNRLVLQPQLG